MCSHRSGCDEEPLLSSSELFPQWWLCSRGFLALFFLLECSWTISMALLEWDWDTSFAHSRICSCVSNTWPKVPPSRRNSEHWFGFQATSPGRADAHKTMYYPASTGSPFCPHRNIFCTQKTRNFLKLLPTGISTCLKILTKAPKVVTAGVWFEELRGCHHAPVRVRGAAEDTRAPGDMWRCEWWTENRFQGIILKMVQSHTGFKIGLNHSQNETRMAGET